MKKISLKYLFILFQAVIIPATLDGQVLNDSNTIRMIRQGVDEIYNCRFEQAGQVLQKLQSDWPDHPVTYLFKGMITYWKHFPLVPASPALKSFRSDMNRCIEMCEKRRLLPGEPEYLLADIGARGLLLTYFADNGLGREVIPMAAKTYQDVVRSFDYTHLYADFYFVTGLYKYYREKYPEVHPFYKPFAIFFPRGDTEAGLTELEKAAGNAVFLRAEALSFLTWINIGYEKNFNTAARYSKMLMDRYPRNNEYLALYVKSLLLLRRNDEAEKMLLQSRKPESRWFRVQKTILQAIIRERKYDDPEEAESLYLSAIKDAAEFGEYASEYLSFCYFGLSRITEAKGELKLSKNYRKKALDLSTYKHIDFGE